MNRGSLTHLISLVFFLIYSVYGYSKVYEDQLPRQEQMDQTIFVVEMISSAGPVEMNNKPFNIQNPNLNVQLTKQGKDGANSIGRSRRAEYGKQKKLLSKSPRAGEILSLSISTSEMKESALEFMRGLYPVRDFILKQKYCF